MHHKNSFGNMATHRSWPLRILKAGYAKSSFLVARLIRTLIISFYFSPCLNWILLRIFCMMLKPIIIPPHQTIEYFSTQLANKLKRPLMPANPCHNKTQFLSQAKFPMDSRLKKFCQKILL